MQDIDIAILEREAIRLAHTGLFFPVPALDGPCTVRVFLEDILKIPHAYVEERIQTLLLNGLAVDNLDTAPLTPGARLALSAAMPGVAGATLRRGGQYAPMRRSITLGEETAAAQAQQAFWLELRCFNDIAREQGLPLARHGVAVPESHLGSTLRPLACALPQSLPASPPRADLLWLQLPENGA